MTSWELLTRQSSALGFSDAAGTDPSTDAVPVLNHGAVASGLTRAHGLSGSEDAKHADNANGKKQLALIMQKRGDNCGGTAPSSPRMMQPERRPQLDT